MLRLPRLVVAPAQPGRAPPRRRRRRRRPGRQEDDDRRCGRSIRPTRRPRAASPAPRGRGRRHRRSCPTGRCCSSRARPDPDAKPDPDKKVNALWALPPDGGEARLLAAPEGGVCGIATARGAHAIVFGAEGPARRRATSRVTPSATKARKDAGVEALLFEDYPIRHWDHYLGPAPPAAVRGDGPGARNGSRTRGTSSRT